MDILERYNMSDLLELPFQTQTDGVHLTYVLVAVEHRLKSLVTHFGLQASSIALNIFSYSLRTSGLYCLPRLTRCVRVTRTAGVLHRPEHATFNRLWAPRTLRL